MYVSVIAVLFAPVILYGCYTHLVCRRQVYVRERRARHGEDGHHAGGGPQSTGGRTDRRPARIPGMVPETGPWGFNRGMGLVRDGGTE